ncbi:MAG TPA: signal peptide peptidase SppA [candidate division WOR-3 bacterium]|uniref:Signal peptide peptidase SppA n=1 Tax=candidate division WOR-3 bacterium TaxID=2052148 RepID=A0A7V0T3X7_UNCW3|nr:signal peptide peptidase SppA [candidate division WOR-3 bacterium]
MTMKRGNVILLVVAAVLLVIGVPFVLLLAVLAAVPSSRTLPEFGPGIGYLTVEGTITDSRLFIRDLKSLEQNPLVKALLIRIDSPGGVVTPSHEIYSEIVRVRDAGTPVVASLGTIAASGGYYIACPADLIVANPGTLTGSIGVIMEFPVVDRLLDKVGIGVEVVKSREHKDIGSPFRRMTPADRALLEGLVLDVYEQFIEIVSLEREMSDAETRRIADGRVLTGRQALAAGLVDTLGTLEDARRFCAELADLKSPARLIHPRRRFSLRLTDLLEVTAERALGLPRFPRLSFVWP